MLRVITFKNLQMKNIKHYFDLKLAVAVSVLFATIGVAQTVSVPAGCRVVVAGVGGTLGVSPTGKVGDGGMVSMPDPLGGGTFTFNPPAGATTITWGLKGDLSNSTTSPNYNAPTQPASGLTANIITYNKFLRDNSTETTNPSWGRSKGQVSVRYDQTGCGKSITFDVYKSFTTALPIIVGPTCLKPLTEYTYSVDRIVSDNANDNIGFDSYYWSGLPDALRLAPGYYTSADNSSITFKTLGTVSEFTLQCCYGRVNPNTGDGGNSTVTEVASGTHTTCVTKKLIISPASPVFSSTTLSTLATLNTNKSACLAVGQPSFTVTYPTPPVTTPATVYAWSALNTGWTFSSSISGSNTTTTVNTNNNNNPGQLTLTITGPCDPAIYNYQINRSIAAPVAIIPLAPTVNTCIAATSENFYTINASAVGVTLSWSTNPSSVTGITLEPSANTNSVKIKASGATPGTSFQLIAKGASPCDSSSITATISVKPVTPAFTAGTPSCVFKSATTQITSIAVTPAGGAGTYAWTLPPTGVTCTANCDTSNPTFILNSAGTSVTLTATKLGVNSCNSVPVSKTINYIAVATSFPGGGFPDQYLVSGACGTVSSWDIGTGTGPSYVVTNYTATTLPNISISNIGGGTNNVLGISGSSGLPITSVCANLTGGVQVCATTIGTFTQKQATSTGDSNVKESIKNAIISPNPNTGRFNIKILDFIEYASATLNDFSGNEIKTFTLQKGENKIENIDLKKGTYFVTLKVDGKQETRQVIVK